MNQSSFGANLYGFTSTVPPEKIEPQPAATVQAFTADIERFTSIVPPKKVVPPSPAPADTPSVAATTPTPAAPSAVPSPSSGNDLRSAIIATSRELGISPRDLATVISFETGGTFDPWKKGPRTKWGQHRGLIQWGEPQRAKYGVYEGMPVADQVRAAGRYLVDAGVKPGMGLLDVYSAINAGRVGRYNASDTAAGGTWGTVRDKVEHQMHGHKLKAARLIGDAENRVDFAQPVPLTSVEPPALPLSPLQRIAEGERMAQRESEASFWQGAGDAYRQDTITARLFESSPTAKPDPEFILTPELQKALTDGVRPEYHERFSTALSMDHAQWIRDRALEDQGREDRLSELGWTGTGLRVAAAVLDPVAIAVGVASGGLADVAALAVGASRAVRIAGQAAAGAAANVAIESTLREVGNPHAGQDLLLTAAAGALFGAGYGVLTRNPLTAGEAFGLARASRSLVNDLKDGTALTSKKNAGAMENLNAQYDLLNDTNFKAVQDKDVAHTAYERLRYDAVGQLKSSPNPISRLIGSFLGEDAVGNANHSLNPFSASEDMERLYRSWFGDFRRSWIPAFHEWADDSQFGRIGRMWQGGAFGEEVTRAVRNTDPTIEFHPAVMRVAEKLRKLNADILENAKNPLVREKLAGRAVFDFAEVPENPLYMWRAYDQSKLNTARQMFGDKGMINWFKGAMRSARPDLDNDIIERIAEGTVRNLHRRANGIDDNLNRAFAGNSDAVAAILRDAGNSEDQITEIIGRLNARLNPKAGADPRSQKRILLDENFVLRGYRRTDGTTGDLSLNDLTLTDASVLTDLYSRHMAGAVALARVRIKNPTTGDMLVDGITRQSEFDTLLTRMKEYGADKGIDPAQLARDEKNLKWLYERIKGAPDPRQQSEWAERLRMLRKFNFMRVMGQVGFAQIPEIGNIVSQLGVRAALSHMPAFRRIVNMKGETVLRHGLDQELEAILGVGTDRLRGLQYFRTDEFGMHNTPRLRSFNNALDVGQRAVAEMSGMTGVTVASHRWAAKAVAQKFANLALNPSKANMKRMASLGIDDPTLKRILDQTRHFTKEDGMLFGGKVTRMNLDNWTDQEVRAAFENALFRWTRRIIQENDLGAMHRWSSSPLWQTIFQFRTFMLTAWHKQFLHNLHMRDFEAFSTMLTTTVLGAAAYAVQENLKAIGRSDADEHLKKRLSPENLAKAAFQRGGWSSIMPMVVDTGTTLAGLNPVFDFRTTGQSSDILFGNPTTGLLDDIKRASKGVHQPHVMGRPRSQTEYRDIVRVLPLQNWMPFTWLLSTMISDAPLRRPR